MQFQAISNVSPNDARVEHYPIQKPRRWKGVDSFYRVIGYNPENYCNEAEFRDCVGADALDLVVPLGQAAAELGAGHEALMLGLEAAELDQVGEAGKLGDLKWFSALNLSFASEHLQALATHAPGLRGFYADGASIDDATLELLCDPTLLADLDVFHALNIPITEAAATKLLKARPNVFWLLAPRSTASS